MPSEVRRPARADAFGLIVVGDEILNGGRSDSHLSFFKRLIGDAGHDLAWHWILPDDPPTLSEHLRFSMSGSDAVFVCGGIGATPDDHTRAAAAAAAGVPLERHPQAKRLIEGRFGNDAYPNRILMADLPTGSELIPNPYNQIPGFSLNRHWFLPGFPQMAWPMAEWVVETRFPAGGGAREELTVELRGVPESRLVPVMRRVSDGLRGVKLFSLPHLGEDSFVLLGVRGHSGTRQAFDRLCGELDAEGLAYKVSQAGWNDGEVGSRVGSSPG